MKIDTHEPGARRTNDILIGFEIQWNLVTLLFVTYSAITTKFCKRQDNVIIVTYVKLHCDRLSIF